MPITLLDAQNALLDYVNRPSSELAAQAKREINNALYWVQRQHEFKYTERLISVTYPANTLQLELTGACEGTPRNWLNVQLLGKSGATTGTLLSFLSYNDLQQERLTFQKSWNQVDNEACHSTFVNSNHLYKCFLISTALGLYPTPSTDVELLVNMHVFLPRLVEDTDTNFLLEVGFDFVIDLALSRMNMYMKEDARVPVSDSALSKSLEALFQWDSQIRCTPNG